MPERFPNHEQQLNRLARIAGQVAGIQKMIEQRRYCIDIVNQIKAVRGALKKVQLGVLEKHLQHCIKDTMQSGDLEEVEKKIDEIVDVFGHTS